VDGETRLVGHYGSSRHDLSVYRVVQGRMSAATFAVGTDPVCDDCIDLALERGDLVYLGEGQSLDAWWQLLAGGEKR
jgi:hypothetical protein